MNDVPGLVLLWLRHPPHSTVHLSEAVRTAAMATALGVPVRLLFIADGVRALVQRQEPYRLGPPIEKMLSGVVTDECPALVHRPSLDPTWDGPRLAGTGGPRRTRRRPAVADWVLQATRVVPF